MDNGSHPRCFAATDNMNPSPSLVSTANQFFFWLSFFEQRYKRCGEGVTQSHSSPPQVLLNLDSQFISVFQTKSKIIMIAKIAVFLAVVAVAYGGVAGVVSLAHSPGT